MPINQADLEYTQGLRKKLISCYTSESGAISPEVSQDPKMAKVFLSALDGMDKQNISTARLENEQDASAKDRELLLAQTKIIQNLARQTGNPFARASGNTKESMDPTALESQLPTIQTVEGQMDKGTSTETYEDFAKKFRDVDTDAILEEDD